MTKGVKTQSSGARSLSMNTLSPLITWHDIYKSPNGLADARPSYPFCPLPFVPSALVSPRDFCGAPRTCQTCFASRCLPVFAVPSTWNIFPLGTCMTLSTASFKYPEHWYYAIRDTFPNLQPPSPR